MFLFSVLKACLSKLNCMPAASGSTFKYAVCIQTDYLMADVLERTINIRCCRQAQQEEYLGKKKQHAIKNPAITDSNPFWMIFKMITKAL